MSDQPTADPYAGLDLPKPPRGYRLAKWGETSNDKNAKWYLVGYGWVDWELEIIEPNYNPASGSWFSIFAVPKPRIRIELEQGEEVE